MEKKCKKCNAVKDVSEFGKHSYSKDGFRYQCKVCLKQYRISNKEKISKIKKKFREANKDSIIDYAKNYRESNREVLNENQRAYYKTNREILNEKKRAVYEVNKKKPTLQELEAEEVKKTLFEDGKKRCSECDVVKKLSQFGKKKSNKYGITNNCKFCISKQRKIYTEANKEKIKEKKKQFYEANKEKIKENHKIYNENNKEKLAIKSKEYQKNNRESILNTRKEYREANKYDILKWNKKYVKERRKIDDFYRFTMNVRSSVKRYLRGGKSKRTREIIGIDFKEFQDYLEVEYTEGMHLDHIIPLSWSINDEEVYILNHYSNFQIITAEENQAKSDSYCKSENLKKVLDNHNNITKLNKIIERNSDKIK
jgi:hypothetical protein